MADGRDADVTEPATHSGRVNGIPARDYHAQPGYGSTLVRAAVKSFRHMQIEARMVATLAMLVGTAVHTLVLEPDNAASVVDSGFATDRGKAHKEAVAAQPDCVVLPSPDYREAHELTRAVLDFNDRRVAAGCADLFDGAAVETSWFANLHGVNLRGRFDLYRPRLIVDLKTTRDDLTDHEFARWIYFTGTYIQAAIYVDIAAAVTGEDPPQFAILAVTKQDHHAVGLRIIADDAIEAGRCTYKRGIRNILDGLAGGHPLGDAYPLDFETVTLPGWAWGDA